MHSARCLSLLLVLPALAGCVSDDGTVAVPDMDWDVPFDVATTAVEPWEQQGYIRVAWRSGLMGIDSEREPDLKRHFVAGPDRVYATQQGLGWTHWSHVQASGGAVSNRYLLWDLPMLFATLPATAAQEGGVTTVHAEGTLPYGGRDMPVEATARVDGTTVLEVRVHSPLGRESPYTFHPAGEGLTFPLRLPPTSKSALEVDRLDSDARAGHVTIIGLIEDYAERRGGQLPQQVTPQALSLEMTLSGVSWPDNPYTGQPMRNARESGHFDWQRCSDTRGLYEGRGWDVDVLADAFGGGCAGTAE